VYRTCRPKATATITLLFLLCAAAHGQTAATQAPTPQGVEAVRARYTKYEYRIPMRDGTLYVHSITRQKISQTWFASHTGASVSSIRRRGSRPRRAPPAVRSQNPAP